MASDDEPKPRSLRDIAARAKEAAAARQSVAPPPGDTADLLGALQGRPSAPPLSSPPGTLGSVPPPPATGDHGPAPTIRSSGLPPPPSRSSTTPGASVRPPSSFPGAPETQRAAASLAVGAPEIAAAVGPPPAGASADEPRPAAPVSTIGVQVTTTEGGHKQEQARRSMMPVLAAVGAVAIAGLVAVMMRRNEPLTVPAGMASASASGAVSAAPAASSAAPAGSGAPAASAAPGDSGGSVDINALASADAATQARVAPAAPASGAATGTAAATAPTAAPVASASAAPRPMGSVGDLQDEMRRRVGATDTGAAPEPTTPSGGNPDAKQDKPSTAAVSGALGAVRGGVKACLADTDKPTRVSVVFQSDGGVRSVSVSGGAAGKADACVIAAVKKARVAPFVADSFSTSFSVSP